MDKLDTTAPDTPTETPDPATTGPGPAPPAPASAANSPRPRGTSRLPWVWIVLGVSFLALTGASGFRAVPGVMMDPLHAEFGWSHASIATAASVNMVLYGAVSPFAASWMEKYGIRPVVSTSLLLIAVGSALPTAMGAPWQLTLYWGVLVGTGSGAVALAFVGTVTNRWFAKHRGLVTGVLTAGSTAGQLVFMPLLAWLVEHTGWRLASFTVAAAAIGVIPLVLFLLREHPRDVGQRPFGASEEEAEAEAAGTAEAKDPEVAPDQADFNPLGVTGPFQVLWRAGRGRAFWMLFGGFAICGATTTGLVQTHFIPAAGDHMMPQTTAAGLLAMAGIFDLIGTVASGWLTDRFNPRVLLFVYYGLRGGSLLVLPSLFDRSATPSMLLFAIFYGLDWVATVPPTLALCQERYGAASAVVFGWLWTAHQVGAGAAAILAGAVRDELGDYASAWYGAGALCLLAAVMALAIGRRTPTIPDHGGPGTGAPTAKETV
ncbi:integral membrane transport protein [Streptomyces albus]|uniref:Integral membrane transport protein n=1 Tax=Streptomyces albus (strain ATCC 21838 / DSM 41398 / FERM P-419 / JCM 4703 / NBRC 107858) TaxID=1081613 RepID=A0A0B5F508_STRA4|nr:integral membrane transport protein [Streptomyces albus]AOU80263.1 integral membrane transport protein [Streptomyces albus]AYN35978.1 MFS transporter [Streptomyces albus]